MKNKLLYIIGLSMAVSTTSCLDDPLPQGSGATADQVAAADKAGIVNGLVQYLNTPYATNSDGNPNGIGYPEHMIYHDVMTADIPILTTGWDYWYAYGQCLYMGDWAFQSWFWWYYNALIYKASLVIQNCDPESETDAFYLATGLAFRAFTLFEMTRIYEYKATGTSLDAEYYERLKWQTVPLVTEYTTEYEAVDNPRVPFYEMYRFILNDLLGAEAAFARTSQTGSKAYASQGMLYGLLARFWLELGTRFDRYPEDLAAQIANDNEQYPVLGETYQDLPSIGITSAAEAYENAANYARRAINYGYTPLSESQWLDKQTGFNTSNNSWMWAIMISSSDEMCTYYTWESWVSFMSPETEYGIAGHNYQGSFMCNSKLFSEISDKDWRKRTWIDPADWVPDNPTSDEQEAFESVFTSKYAPYTNLDFDTWSTFAPYVGFKYHPGGGNMTSSTSGNKVDIPLMRVEEMYFIEAEAIAKSQGLAAGISALESFMNSYRYTDGSYKCRVSTTRDFEKELLRQKRIEFWGEGIILFDYRRLELPIERGFDGSNYADSYQFNSLDGYVAPWTTLYIPLSEGTQNTAMTSNLNPDPSIIMEELRYSK